MAYMYILHCSNNTYYVGSTVDLDRRIAEHKAGEGANYTRKHAPVELMYYEEFARIDQAFEREQQIKKWSRKKKEALINGDLKLVSKLAKKRFRG